MKILYRRATLEDASSVARVHCASWRSTYPGLIPDHVIDAWADVERRTDGWRRIIAERPETLWLATRDGEVIGFADGGVAREPNDGVAGQLFGIYLLASAQRNGVGRELVSHVFSDLHRWGFGSARVEVLKGNLPAIRFYEKLGARFVREAPFEMMGDAMFELVYVWDELPDLTGWPA
ncbi:MAG: GNAT family N-acetyltransferase [Casimicrobium sp.]